MRNCFIFAYPAFCRLPVCMIWTFLNRRILMRYIYTKVGALFDTCLPIGIFI